MSGLLGGAYFVINYIMIETPKVSILASITSDR